jgi:hypothetical protein
VPVQIDKLNWRGWPNSYRISNGQVEMIVTSDVGPRIMHYGFAGGQNFFKEFTAQLGQSGEPDWQPRGGHRIWIAPEDPVKSYAPDNGPVHIAIHSDLLTATEPVEPLTGIEKRLDIRLAPSGTAVEVVHHLRNAGATACTLAPWALTMMAQGGYGIHGFPQRGTHPEILAPTNPLVMWAFTNLADPRWRLLRKYMVLQQDPANADPQKLGTFNRHTWGAYLLNNELFVKRLEAAGEPADYPDYGCSYETFTNADILELETLGPIRTLAPGGSLTHAERWSAFRNVRVADWDDDELDRVILPLVNAPV